MGRFQSTFREKHAVIGQNGDRIAPDPRKTRHKGRAIERFELVKMAVIDDAGNDLAHIVRCAHIRRDDAVKFGRIQTRGLWLGHIHLNPLDGIEVGHNRADDLEGMLIIIGNVIDNA